MNEMTGKLEDYLEAVYVLNKQNAAPVRIKQVAEFLKVSKTTVVAMVKKLKNLELVEQEHYGYIYLKSKGEKIAGRIADRHRALRSFLSDVLCLGSETAEEEACRMEHILGEETIRRIALLSDRLKEEAKLGKELKWL